MKLFNIYLVNKVYVGKKMNFLLQEMLRETNTIGSKAGNIKVNHIIINIKSTIEQLKEQIQNIL